MPGLRDELGPVEVTDLGIGVGRVDLVISIEGRLSVRFAVEFAVGFADLSKEVLMGVVETLTGMVCLGVEADEGDTVRRSDDTLLATLHDFSITDIVLDRVCSDLERTELFILEDGQEFFAVIVLGDVVDFWDEMEDFSDVDATPLGDDIVLRDDVILLGDDVMLPGDTVIRLGDDVIWLGDAVIQPGDDVILLGDDVTDFRGGGDDFLGDAASSSMMITALLLDLTCSNSSFSRAGNSP